MEERVVMRFALLSCFLLLVFLASSCGSAAGGDARQASDDTFTFRCSYCATDDNGNGKFDAGIDQVIANCTMPVAYIDADGLHTFIVTIGPTGSFRFTVPYGCDLYVGPPTCDTAYTWIYPNPPTGQLHMQAVPQPPSPTPTGWLAEPLPEE
jgi:hypothetical protein